MDKVKTMALNCSFRKGVEILVLCKAVLLLWSFQTLPVIFYSMQEEYSRNNSEQMGSDAAECSNPHMYGQNGICFSQLKEFFSSHTCQLSQNDTILASRNSEQMARFLLTNFNRLNPSPECEAAILPFFCLYLFGLCDGAGELVQPTRDQCEDLQLVTCAREWRIAAQFGTNLPECDSLPSMQTVTCPSYSNLTSESSPSTLSSTNSSILTCQEHFMYDQNLQGCVANCYTWNFHDDKTTIIYQVTLLSTYLIGIILAVIVLVISGIRYKAMFQFPSTFLIYTTVDNLVLDFFGVLSASNRNLYCSSPSLLNTTVTPLCSTYGIVFSYFIVQLQFWWLFHVSIWLWGISLPFHYQKIKKTKVLTYLHILLVILGIFLPSIPIISTTSRYANLQPEQKSEAFISGGIGYGSFTWPSIICAQFDVYSVMLELLLPIEILLAIGGPLLFVAFYILYKNRKQFGTAEKKLLLMFSYYLLITLLVIGAFTWAFAVDTANKEAITEYFICEGGGHNPEQPCRKDHRNYSYDRLAITALATFAINPINALIVVVSSKDLKKIFQKCNLFSSKKKMSK